MDSFWHFAQETLGLGNNRTRSIFTLSIFNELKRRNVIRVGIAYLVVAWLIMQISDVILNNITAPDWVFHVMLLFLAAGFPLAVFFAWAFEMTPEGLKRENEVDRSESITTQTGRKLDRMIIGILTVAVAYLLLDKLVLTDYAEPAAESVAQQETAAAPEDESPSVAVLPFVNMSGDQENEYFSDGLTETLLHMLAQLPGLRVAARTSSFAFKGQNTSVAEIAETLGVAHILEGSVQKANDRVRVTAQLIRADDGFHVWSQNYTRPLEDIFAIQDEIAGDVADALGSTLLGGVSSSPTPVSTQNLSAYDTYLRGLEQQANKSFSSYQTAEDLFKQALASDPDFVDARLALAQNYLYQQGTGLITTDDEVRALITPLLRQTLDNEPENHLARALELTLELALADVVRAKEESQEMIDELRDLLQYIPAQTFIRTRLADALFFGIGKEQESIEVLQAGLLIDPLDPELHASLGDLYADQEKLDDARQSLKRALELEPDNPNTYANIAGIEQDAGNLVASLDWMRKASELDPRDHEIAWHIGKALFDLNLSEEAERWYGRVQAIAPGSAVARDMELRRALSRGEQTRAMDLARAMIVDDIETRRGSFGNAVISFDQLMIENNRAGEAYELHMQLRPEIANYNEIPPDFKGFILQWTTFNLLSALEDDELRNQKWTQFDAAVYAKDFPWLEDPSHPYHLFGYILSGESEKAEEHFLTYDLNELVADNLDLLKKQLSPLYDVLYADPRVAAKMAERGRQVDDLPEQVSDLMMQSEWN